MIDGKNFICCWSHVCVALPHSKHNSGVMFSRRPTRAKKITVLHNVESAMLEYARKKTWLGKKYSYCLLFRKDVNKDNLKCDNLSNPIAGSANSFNIINDTMRVINAIRITTILYQTFSFSRNVISIQRNLNLDVISFLLSIGLRVNYSISNSIED